MPTVHIPTRYRGPTQGKSQIDVEGRTVRECIEAVEAQHPGFLELVFDKQGKVRRFARVFLNGDDLGLDAADTTVDRGDRVEILAAVAGG
jgi:molybdopterin converting factor small subunit